ncbi:MAG: hypothetical protein SPI35_07390 [Porphyromonas sp.]|nr:hypothetical protein [Porphyromonas sp.]
MKKVFFALSAFALIGMIFTGCKKEVEVKGLSLSAESLAMLVGEEKTIGTSDESNVVVTVVPKEAKLEITSSAPAIVTVSDGKLSAKAEGEAVITVKAGKKSATLKVSVVKLGDTYKGQFYIPQPFENFGSRESEIVAGMAKMKWNLLPLSGSDHIMKDPTKFIEFKADFKNDETKRVTKEGILQYTVYSRQVNQQGQAWLAAIGQGTINLLDLFKNENVLAAWGFSDDPTVVKDGETVIVAGFDNKINLACLVFFEKVQDSKTGEEFYSIWLQIQPGKHSDYFKAAAGSTSLIKPVVRLPKTGMEKKLF